MNARSLLVALFCVSCVFSYGPLFIMSKGEYVFFFSNRLMTRHNEQYYGSNLTTEEVEEIIKEKVLS